MGDFNEGCSYVSKKKEAKLPISHAPYKTLIPSNADTTTSASHCAYDRFVVSGQGITDAVEKVTILHYDRDADNNPIMNNKEVPFPFPFPSAPISSLLHPAQAKRISDHYPIHLVLGMHE